MPLTLASAGLSDDEFLVAFDRCQLPPAMFRHGDHLRFAWLTLHRNGFNDALRLVPEGIRRFAHHHGADGIFHQTVTAAWVHLLASHREATFADFLQQHQGRLNKDLLHRFWSPELLDSPQAKDHWVPPDHAPLPARA